MSCNEQMQTKAFTPTSSHSSTIMVTPRRNLIGADVRIVTHLKALIVCMLVRIAIKVKASAAAKQPRISALRRAPVLPVPPPEALARYPCRRRTRVPKAKKVAPTVMKYKMILCWRVNCNLDERLGVFGEAKRGSKTLS